MPRLRSKRGQVDLEGLVDDLGWAHSVRASLLELELLERARQEARAAVEQAKAKRGAIEGKGTVADGQTCPTPA